MTSVADIPDDANDDLSGISPELVLVDPELARLARERQAVPTTPALTRGSTLRLVREVDRTGETVPPIVPRAMPAGADVQAPPPVPDEAHAPVTSEPATGDPVRAGSAALPASPVEAGPAGDIDEDVPTAVVDPGPEIEPIVVAPPIDPGPSGLVPIVPAAEADVDSEPIVPAAAVVPKAEPEPIVPALLVPATDSDFDSEPIVPAAAVEPETEPIVPAAPRIVEAEPARALAQPPRREIPAPLAEPVRRSRPEELHAPEPGSPTAEMSVPVMPHPVARPSSAAPIRRTPSARRKRRRGLALLLAVAAACVAVLGYLQLTGGASDPSGTGAERGTVGTPPRAKTTHPSKAGKVAKAKVPNAGTKQKAKPTSKSSSKRTSTPTKAKTTTAKAAKASPSTQSKPSPPTSKPKVVPRRPKLAASSAPKSSSSATASTAPSATTPPPAAAPKTRRFAWAPVTGATGYHVELFRGADRVLAQDTKEPVLELGSSWRYDGRTVQLTPGAYRWYVWPVTANGRATQAVVQAKLTIP